MVAERRPAVVCATRHRCTRWRAPVTVGAACGLRPWLLAVFFAQRGIHRLVDLGVE